MDAELARLRGELEEARKTVTHLERRQAMDALLADAEAVDLEAARLLTEAAVAAMTEPDVKLAVEDLRRTKPYLFARRSGARGSAMGARVRESGEDAEAAAERAATSGDRRDLLRYLRLKRRR